MVFPTTRLDFKCEIAFGVDPNGVAFINPPEWTDVTEYFLDQSIQITRGRANETETTQVMGMGFELDNIDGIFTPDNAESILYPYVRRGTIMRYGIYGGDSYLSYKNSINDTAVACSTPDNAALDITGDIDIALQIQPYAIVGLTPLVTKYVSTSNQRSFFLCAQPDPDFPNFYRFLFEWSTDGTVAGAQAIATPYAFSYHNQVNVRFTLDVNNGAGGFTGRWYIARKWGEDWNEISNTVGVGVTSIFNSTAPVELMANSSFTATTDNFLGKIYRVQIKNGIDGTLVANPDFRTKARGTTGFTDSVGRVWTVGPGAEITNLHERFFGNIDSWQLSWPNGDTTGTQPPESRVVCQASSVRRRLGQGSRPLPSPIRRYVLGQDNLLVGYWPFEDEDGSTQVANGIANQPAGVVNDLSQIAFGSDDTIIGSLSLAKLGTSFEFVGEVNTYVASAPLTWATSVLYKIPTDISVPTVLMEIYCLTGSVGRFEFSIDSSTQYRIRAYNPAGVIIDEAVGNHSDLYVGKWGTWFFSAIQSGADIFYSAQWYAEDNLTTTPTFGGGSTIVGTTLGNVDKVRIPPGVQMLDVSIGHLQVVIGSGQIYTNEQGQSALTGYTGETATNRFNRICGEEIVACNSGMPGGGSTDMGPQEINDMLNLFDDLATSSNSIFLDARFFRGLQYIPLYDMLDVSVQLALNAAAEHITNPLSPTLDDQNLRNAFESSRPGGSTVLRQNDLSVAQEGEYLTQVTVNVERDDQLGDDANWRLHIGVQDDMAYPPITMDLSKTQTVADALIPIWLHDLTDVGCLITLSNLPRQADSTIKMFLLQGYTETITPTSWTVSLNCVPYQPYMVTWFDNDFVALKLAPESTTLDVGINSSVGSFVGNLNGIDTWTTDPADMPILIEMGGEQMNVTAISAVASGKQTFTVTRSVNGVVKSHDAGEAVTLAYPAFLSLV